MKYAVRNRVVTLTGNVDSDLESEGQAENLGGKVQKKIGQVETVFEK